MHFTLLFVGILSVLPQVLGVMNVTQLLDFSGVTYNPDCSSKYINRVTSCVTTQQCGRGGITSPLDSCQMRWFAQQPFIDNESELGYNTVFRFKMEDTDPFLHGTFTDSFDTTSDWDGVLLDQRYANNGASLTETKIFFFEIHPHYFSDLKLKLSAVSGVQYNLQCRRDLDDTSDCGTPGKSQLYCPIHVRVFHPEMCFKCYKAIFGVKGKPRASYNYAGVVELYVRIKGESLTAGKGYYYHVTNEIANRVVSDVCDSACVLNGEGYCPDSEETCDTTIDSSNEAFPTAIHDHMYLREIDCSPKLEVDDPICQRKARRRGANHYKSGRVVFNVTNGRPSCDCLSHAFWDLHTQECVKICDSIPCNGDNEIAGSCVAYYNRRNYVCSCDTGHTWNKDTKGCVADAAAPAAVCDLPCKKNQHCVYLASDPSAKRCVCDGGYSLFEGEGECVAL